MRMQDSENKLNTREAQAVPLHEGLRKPRTNIKYINTSKTLSKALIWTIKTKILNFKRWNHKNTKSIGWRSRFPLKNMTAINYFDENTLEVLSLSSVIWDAYKIYMTLWGDSGGRYFTIVVRLINQHEIIIMAYWTTQLTRNYWAATTPPVTYDAAHHRARTYRTGWVDSTTNQSRL